MNPTTPRSTSWPWIVAAGVLIILTVALAGRSWWLRTDVVTTEGAPITLATDKLLYRAEPGEVVPVQVWVDGATVERPLMAAKLVLDGLPEGTTVAATSEASDGSVRINRVGAQTIVLLSDVRVTQASKVMTLSLTLPDQQWAPTSAVPVTVVSRADDPVLVSQVASYGPDGQYEAYPINDGIFFRLASSTSSPSPTISPTPTPTCQPRPACLDAEPRCLLPEPAEGWCPVETEAPTPCPLVVLPDGRIEHVCPSASPTASPVYCTDDVRECPDGSYVARDPDRNCAFPACPGEACQPRPACLDAEPRCLLPEPAEGWCPVETDAPTPCPLVALPDGRIEHVCPSASPTAPYSPMPTAPYSPMPTAPYSPMPTGSGTLVSPSPVQCLPLRGDVNCDGRIGFVDLVLLADALAGKLPLTQRQMSNGNVAEVDLGVTNMADVAAFAAFIAGKTPSL